MTAANESSTSPPICGVRRASRSATGRVPPGPRRPGAADDRLAQRVRPRPGRAPRSGLAGRIACGARAAGRVAAHRTNVLPDRHPGPAAISARGPSWQRGRRHGAVREPAPRPRPRWTHRTRKGGVRRQACVAGHLRPDVRRFGDEQAERAGPSETGVRRSTGSRPAHAIASVAIPSRRGTRQRDRGVAKDCAERTRERRMRSRENTQRTWRTGKSRASVRRPEPDTGLEPGCRSAGGDHAGAR